MRDALLNSKDGEEAARLFAEANKRANASMARLRGESMSDSWRQVRIEHLAELKRKAAALDFLLAHPCWTVDNMPPLGWLTAENALKEIEDAMVLDVDSVPAEEKP